MTASLLIDDMTWSWFVDCLGNCFGIRHFFPVEFPYRHLKDACLRYAQMQGEFARHFIRFFRQAHLKPGSLCRCVLCHTRIIRNQSVHVKSPVACTYTIWYNRNDYVQYTMTQLVLKGCR